MEDLLGVRLESVLFFVVVLFLFIDLWLHISERSSEDPVAHPLEGIHIPEEDDHERKFLSFKLLINFYVGSKRFFSNQLLGLVSMELHNSANKLMLFFSIFALVDALLTLFLICGGMPQGAYSHLVKSNGSADYVGILKELARGFVPVDASLTDLGCSKELALLAPWLLSAALFLILALRYSFMDGLDIFLLVYGAYFPFLRVLIALSLWETVRRGLLAICTRGLGDFESNLEAFRGGVFTTIARRLGRIKTPVDYLDPAHGNISAVTVERPIALAIYFIVPLIW